MWVFKGIAEGDVRHYLSIDDIQREYLPIVKKQIRALVKENLSVKMLGGRMYVERSALEEYLKK